MDDDKTFAVGGGAIVEVVVNDGANGTLLWLLFSAVDDDSTFVDGLWKLGKYGGAIFNASENILKTRATLSNCKPEIKKYVREGKTVISVMKKQCCILTIVLYHILHFSF